MNDDQLEAAWTSFADALRENERSKIKRRWLLLAEQRSRLSDLGQSQSMARAYQWMAMAGAPRQQHSQARGLVSGPLSFLGL